MRRALDRGGSPQRREQRETTLNPNGLSITGMVAASGVSGSIVGQFMRVDDCVTDGVLDGVVTDPSLVAGERYALVCAIVKVDP